jgi:YVTN family beta-propeller protein
MGLAHKSQSALEYMMTYGWAILVIVIVAVLLYSLGIFSPSSYVSTSITGFSGVTVSAASVSPIEVGIEVQDISGSPIQITAVNATLNGKTYTSFICDQTTIVEGGNTECFVSGNFGSAASISSVHISIGYLSIGIFKVPYTSIGTVTSKLASYIQGGPFQASNNIAYVGSWSGAIAEINTSDDRLIDVIGNPTWSTSQLVFSSNGSVAYIPDDWTTLGVFNSSSFQLLKKYWTGGCGDSFMTLSPNGKYAFISLDGCSQDAVDVVNLSNPNTFSDFKRIPTLYQPNQIITASNGDIYVTDGGSDAVSVINPVTLQNIDNITNIGVGNGNSWRMAYNSVNGNLYIPSGTTSVNPSYNNLSIVSTQTNSVVGSLTGLGPGPNSMVLSSSGKLIYITQSYSYVCCSINQGALAIMNASDYNVIKNIPVGNDPRGVTIAPNGYIYVVNSGSNTVSIINNNTNTITSTLSGNGLNNPQYVAITNGYVYVTNWNSGTVSVFSLSTGDAVSTLSVGSNPYRIMVSPTNSSQVYLSNYGSNTISVIDANTNSVVDTINVNQNGNCNQPEGIAFLPDGDYAYVACWSNNAVAVVDSATNTFTGTVIGGVTNNGGIRAIVASNNGQYVYVGGWNEPNNDLSIISTATNQLIERVPATGQSSLTYLLMSKNGNKVFALFQSWADKYAMEVLNPNNLEFETGVGFFFNIQPGCGGDPSAIAISPNGKFAALGAQGCNEEVAVSMINLTSGAVMYSTPLKQGDIGYEAFSNDGSLLYVDTGNSIEAINTLNGNIEYTSEDGNCPGPITVSSAGLIYETFTCQSNSFIQQGQNGMVILSPTLQVIKYVYGPGIGVFGLAMSSSGSNLLISSSAPSLTYLSTSSNTIPIPLVCGIPCSGNSEVLTNGNIAYVTQNNDWQNGSVSVYNITTTSSTGISSFIPIGMIDNVGSDPYGIAITPNHQDLYITTGTQGGVLVSNGLQRNSSVAVISTSNNQVIDRIIVPGCPNHDVVTPNGGYVLVTSQCLPSNSIIVISTSSNSVTKVIPVGGCPGNIAVNPTGTLAFVTDQCSNSVHVINLTSMQQIQNIGGGGLNSPRGIAIAPNGMAYIANWNTDQISVLNTSAAVLDPSNAFLTPITIPEADNWRGIVIGAPGAYST